MCLETDLFQEEDFVTQLYNRSLLTEFGVDGFQKLIDQAILWVDEQGGNIDDDLRDAIKSRLVLRRELLAALEQDLRVIDTRSTDNFKNCLAQLSPLAKSVTLGKPVSDAFSLKIQRRLASTIPPRPMVNINVEDALAHLKRLCQDAIDLEQILDYRGPHNFRVCVLFFILFSSDLLALHASRSLFGLCCRENLNLRSISGRLFNPLSQKTRQF